MLNLTLNLATEAFASADILVGSKVVINKTITKDDVQLFGQITGDMNPIHHKGEKAIVHGALLNGLVSGVIGTKLPGPGTLVVRQTLRFPNSCYVGDTVSVSVEITDVRRLISCIFKVESISNKMVVLEGDAMLLLKKKD